MREKRATLEVIAPTVEEAVEKGLSDLGLPADAVEVEILDQGSRGLFGIGSRQARIRLAVKSAQKDAAGQPVEAPETSEVEPELEGEPAAAYPRPEKRAVQDVSQDLNLHVARETVLELVEKMKVTAEISARYGEVDEGSSRLPIYVDVRGNDLSILIGRRAETLNALQYIAGLIVSKEIGRTVSLVIDIEGYRSRREGQLRQLARRMAEQAVKTGRKQVLEPMPANERRIIHMELREYSGVKTESIGEDPRRKVTIIPNEE
jgi:spoIIIJ-associated protein